MQRMAWWLVGLTLPSLGATDHAHDTAPAIRSTFADEFAKTAVGGDWGGQKGVDKAALPQAMKVDYVRYWQR